MEIKRSGSQPSGKGPMEYCTGTVRVDPLFNAPDPLTVSGIAGVASKDVSAASGLVNVAHQLGDSFGFGILVTVFAAASSGSLDTQNLLAHRVATSLTAGTAMLALAFVFALIVRPRTVQHARSASA
jgi:hypothetical protein